MFILVSPNGEQIIEATTVAECLRDLEILFNKSPSVFIDEYVNAMDSANFVLLNFETQEAQFLQVTVAPKVIFLSK